MHPIISMNKKNLKLLFISHGLDGGINRVTSDLHTYLRNDANTDSTIIRIGEGRDSLEIADASMQEHNITLRSNSKNIFLRIATWITGLNDVKRLVGKNKYDIIVYSGIIPAILMSRTLRSSARSHVFWEHGPQKTFLGIKRLVTRFLPTFDGVMSPAKSSMAWMRQNLRIRARDYKVISNWVNWQYIVPSTCTNDRSSFLKIIVVSRIDYRQKDFDTLLHAISKLVQSGTTSLFVDIFGAGEDIPKLEQSIEQLHLQEFVMLKGHANDIYTRLALYDVSILPTKWEGFGLSVAESMAARVVPISAAVEGVVDVIDSNINGFLYESGNPQSLCQAILEVINQQRSERESMRDAGRAKVLAQYTPAIQLEKIKNFLQVISTNG